MRPSSRDAAPSRHLLSQFLHIRRRYKRAAHTRNTGIGEIMPTAAFVKASLAPFVRTLINRFKFAARIGRVIPAKRWRVARSPAALQRRFSPVTVLAVLRCASYVF